MKDERKWYQKKRFILPIIAGGILFTYASSNQSNTYTSPTYTPSVNTYQAQPYRAENTNYGVNTTNTYTPSSNLSNDNTYTNTYGNTIHSPAYSNSVPAGASAQCRDGTYSFSQSRRGTCSHHGGVATWL